MSSASGLSIPCTMSTTTDSSILYGGSSSPAFAICNAELGGDYAFDNPYQLTQCVAYESAKATSELTRSLFLIFAAALAFFMQAGFAMVCAGAVKTKNVQNTMLKNLLDACGSSIAFFAVGYAFAFGGWDDNHYTDPNQDTGKTFIGTSNFFLVGVEDYPFWLFQYALSATAATIVAGTLAERCQMVAYMFYSVLLTGWVYPVIAHAVWSNQGFLSATAADPLFGVGMIDFSGSGVIHVTGGFTALLATKFLGPRIGRFTNEDGDKLETPKEFPGHSIALQMLGTFILWFGWYGFNSGSALIRTTEDSYSVAALAGVTTTLAAGSGGMTALFVNLFYYHRVHGEPIFDLKYAMNGALSGLVAVTAPCAVVEPWAGVVIGFIAGLLLLVGSKGLLYLRIDDVVDAIPVHFVNGVWGVISVGFFASPARLEAAYQNSSHPGLFYAPDGTLLGAQLVGLLFITAWVFVLVCPFFAWLDWRGWLRADALDELVGLDTSYHNAVHLIGVGEDPNHVSEEHIDAYKQRKAERRRLESSSPFMLAAKKESDDTLHTKEDDNGTEKVDKDEEDKVGPDELHL